MHLLTRAEVAFEAQAVEVIAFAVLPPHLTKLIWMAGTLSAQTVPSSTADWAVWLRYAVYIVRWAVVLHWALASWAQTTLVTLTHPTLIAPVTVATQGAVDLCLCSTIATTGKVHRDLQRIFEAQRLDGKSAALLLRAATQLSLHTEWHLMRMKCLC